MVAARAQPKGVAVRARACCWPVGFYDLGEQVANLPALRGGRAGRPPRGEIGLAGLPRLVGEDRE